MDIFSAIALGILQGITEFLPVSSSGHLVIGQHLLGWREPNVFFDVCLHVGTLIAVALVFHQDIAMLVRGGLNWLRHPLSDHRDERQEARRIFVLVLWGTIPTVIIGFACKDLFERLFASVTAVGLSFLVTGTLLWLTHRRTFFWGMGPFDMRFRHAVLVGLVQGLAITPGISRSGTTIAVGLLLGFQREWAGRYSFLLFVPAILGAVTLGSLHLKAIPNPVHPVLWGTVAAALTGYLALRFLLALVRRGRVHLFAPYCWTLGLVCLGLKLLERGNP
ncbi:undecaprenyl-diphosphate phosphatase [Desulfosoma caldarium]|uniref:Undecaprenyl-diphosphatase n=1 Tax=Desulfosoma caldarium TaxID=610254 RepID=A0A3N1UKX2_9BACT|nr:undecaprenyl-diphosphate phosphatase [Desulfosoma caldarium]ROQ90793.1 undecaprenyl-diphosphatase [Desulfosoma caldarium]